MLDFWFGFGFSFCLAFPASLRPTTSQRSCAALQIASIGSYTFCYHILKTPYNLQPLDSSTSLFISTNSSGHHHHIVSATFDHPTTHQDVNMHSAFTYNEMKAKIPEIKHLFQTRHYTQCAVKCERLLARTRIDEVCSLCNYSKNLIHISKLIAVFNH